MFILLARQGQNFTIFRKAFEYSLPLEVVDEQKSQP